MAGVMLEFIFIVIALALALVFHKDIYRWYLKKKNKAGDVKFASKGAEIHAPYNVTGTVASIEPYSQGNDPNLILLRITDSRGDEHERILNPQHDLKPYNVEDSLTDRDTMMWCTNVTKDGKRLPKYLGIDFTDSAIDATIGVLESKNIAFQKLLIDHTSSPLEMQALLKRSELQGKMARNISGGMSQQMSDGKRAPIISIENLPGQQDDNEDEENK